MEPTTAQISAFPGLRENHALLCDQSDLSFMVARRAHAFDANAKEGRSMTTNSANPGPVLNRAMFAALILAGYLAVPETTLAAQTIVESEAPKDADLALGDEPSVRIGILDGPMEYMFGEVTGAIRLEDESVVVADEQSYEVPMFDARGRHLWTSGRKGEEPGEYGGLRLLRGCPGAAITVFDWHLDRITELSLDGEVADTRALSADRVPAYSEPACSPDGSFVFTPWPETDYADLAVDEIYRWKMSLNWRRRDGVITLRSGIPGTERFFSGGGTGPRGHG